MSTYDTNCRISGRSNSQAISQRNSMTTAAMTKGSERRAMRQIICPGVLIERNTDNEDPLAVLPVRDYTGCLGRSETRVVRQTPAMPC